MTNQVALRPDAEERQSIYTIANLEGMAPEFYDLRTPVGQEYFIQQSGLETWRKYFAIVDEVMAVDNRQAQTAFYAGDSHSWTRYYEAKNKRFGGGESGYRNYHIRRMLENAPYFCRLVDEIRQRPYCSVAELGFGAGSTLIELNFLRNQLGIRSLNGVDLETSRLAKHNTNSIRRFFGDHGDAGQGFLQGDFFRDSIPEVDVLYHHGVLEHLDESNVVGALEICLSKLRQGGVMVFTVPLPQAHLNTRRRLLPMLYSSQGSVHRNFGDERPYEAREWEYFIYRAGGNLSGAPISYWVPEYRDTLRHPVDPINSYRKGEGMLAVYTVQRMNDNRVWQGAITGRHDGNSVM